MRSKTATPFTVGRRSKVRTAADELWEEGEEEGGGATGGEGRGFDGENPLGTQVDEEVSSQGGVFKPVYAEDGFIMARREPARQVRRERERERERTVLCMIVLNVHVLTCIIILCIPCGRKFSREPIFAVFTVNWRSTKIKSAK